MFISERLNPATAFPQQFCIVQEVTRVLRKISCNAIPSESQKEGSVELTLEKTGQQEHKTKYSSRTVDLGHRFGAMSCDFRTTACKLG